MHTVSLCCTSEHDAHCESVCCTSEHDAHCELGRITFRVAVNLQYYLHRCLLTGRNRSYLYCVSEDVTFVFASTSDMFRKRVHLQVF